MNKRIYTAFIAFMLSLATLTVFAQDEPVPVDGKIKKELIDSITSQYFDWQTISLSGKLSSNILPISPSVKIYMEKGNLIVVSVSAPLIGEAMRIEIDKKEVLIVNKLKNTFSKTVIAEVDAMTDQPVNLAFPGGIEAIQNILLGRISLAGSGELSKKNADAVEIYDATPELWLIMPEQDMENGLLVYYYTVDKATLQLVESAVLSQIDESFAVCDYSWGKKDTTLDFNIAAFGYNMTASLKLNSPDSKTKIIDRIKLGSKYQEVQLSRVFRF